ncbi:MAG: hypothetical protein COV59_03645 [Candidatus Magasanikbacteria bacterium CG11_big_fil_rev_8_21_14_0_20_39_34]|uniref:Penicillin-binding protein transpeptidase domain-containing protein n=1 Tax=Candidatus Magasanikbacteria bacterium CG11_big_fil_rev_8_21_14_0_20_39_34 TaxID=1974653 RepID=A0A2H0N5S4_9BACT|nr:MAG: hypothetical protein COV59_03645 [Candidatus Magasanikbacteria bacterium CG11_big_fil_rev_8_21_14_0_20_39_34]
MLLTQTIRKEKMKLNEGRRNDLRLRVVAIAVAGAFFVVCVRLFVLMILEHDFYNQLAIGSHEIYSQLFPKRGNIFIQDTRTGEEFPLAMNKNYFTLYANTREILTDDQANTDAEKLSEILHYDDEKKLALFLKLNKRNDPYEPIESKVDESLIDLIKAENLEGIYYTRLPYRYYPEKQLASSVVGFLGKNSEGLDVGRYGLEGYWQKILAGSGGFLEGTRSGSGGLIAFAHLSLQPAEDGADLLLTIDRALQYGLCSRLTDAMKEYNAKSATLIAMDPGTGAILSMCSLPEFDPNEYNRVEDSSVFNNSAIFTPYEPGSVFKPLIMAAAINEGLVEPNSYFFDSGSVDASCQKKIQNADGKKYEDTDMTGILDNSINTGMVYVATKLGKMKFTQYVEKYGFGLKTGIRLDTESAGTIDSLYKNSGDKIDCYTATASFGQGITVTPLQMVSAFSVLANGGELLRPYIVQEVRYPNGKREKTKREVIERILDRRTASLISGMLVSVVDKGHATAAQVHGYYVAGKTGTAQIAGPGGYTDETNHTFLGFGPVDNPKFVILVKFEKPERAYSSNTSAPVFSKLADFMLKYYRIPPTRE